VDRTENKSGELKYYVDLKMQMGGQFCTLRFFLTNLGDNKCILGYPWFVAGQPCIDWRRGWIDYKQLPMVLHAPGAERARFIPRKQRMPRPLQCDQYFIGRIISQIPNEDEVNLQKIPAEYRQHKKVFSEQESQRLLKHMVWDHTIELLPGAPNTLPGCLLPLTQEEIQEQEKFVAEHLKRGTIRPSDSPFGANYFYVRKKDGKLRPVQDYRPLNKRTKKDRTVSPLIPQVIDCLSRCTLFMKFDIRWGYNNIRIKEGDEWKAAFLTKEGLFKPTVMFFRLTNSPATFQRMMNTIFQPEVAQGWLSVYMDDMAIHTKPCTNETEEQHLQWH
jgi:Reverse transcriptase (RNA-dependent DNA polymerase)